MFKVHPLTAYYEYKKILYLMINNYTSKKRLQNAATFFWTLQ
jgi:hypothetical protein